MQVAFFKILLGKTILADLVDQAPVVWKVDNSVHRINHYPMDNVVCFLDTYSQATERDFTSNISTLIESA